MPAKRLLPPTYWRHFISHYSTECCWQAILEGREKRPKRSCYTSDKKRFGGFRSRAGAAVRGTMGTPSGIRIRVATLKGWCPRPLDDGGRVVFPAKGEHLHSTRPMSGLSRARGRQSRLKIW